MKKISALIASSVTFFAVALPAFAQTDVIATCDTTSSFRALCGFEFTSLFTWAITIAFIVASLIAMAFLIFGGIKWITSGGDKAGVEAARNMIVAALVGLVITFLAYFIIQFIFTFFNLGSFTSGFKLPTIPTSVVPN